MILATTQRAARPGVGQVKGERRVHADGRMQRRGLRPRPKTHPRHMLAHAAGWLQRQGNTVDRDHVPVVVQAQHTHLQPLDRRIDIAHRAAGGALLAHHVPWLKRTAQRERDAAGMQLAHQREAERKMRRKPAALEGVTGFTQIRQHIVEIHLYERPEQEAVVQLGAPARQARGVRRVPEASDQRAQQQLLHQAHARVRRHLEAAQLQQAEPASGPVGRVELVDAELGAVRVAGYVDQDVAQDAVDQPGRHLGTAVAPHANRAKAVKLPLQLGKGDFQFIDLVVARLIHARRLTGRANEQPREQVRQRWVVVPVRDQAGEQIRPTQERAISRRGPAQYEVVTAASARMAAVEHEFLGAQVGLVGRFVQVFRMVHQLAPVGCGVDVDLDDAGVGCHLQQLQARVTRRRIAFDDDLYLQLGSGGLHGGQQVKVVVQLRQRRHEDVQQAFAAAEGVVLDLGASSSGWVARFHA